ncbi:hypothetical protein SO802_020999 [Lithocarpus litseifolius]|uniref:Uncharacterized protein n=1 Tax=Lithocarpus litseifolius TaxID=425828 RepID=A0AAW2CF57_9ROSI
MRLSSFFNLGKRIRTNLLENLNPLRMSDTENDSSDEYVDECGHFMAFAATTDKVIVESATGNEDSSDDEVPKKLT